MSVLLVNANALQIPLADKSVHCVVTSPPYWGLRDYQVPGQLGMEPTPQEYVEHMVNVFRECRRVLRDDGTLWLNLGDSYASAWACHRRSTIGAAAPSRAERANMLTDGLKEKDLVGIPWRVAFALQADGWYLRQDIIWAKPNPMPESVTDRCTKSHEYIFLLSKSARYFYDAEAILEPVSANTHLRISQDLANQIGSYRANGGAKSNGPMKAVGRKPKASWNGSTFDGPRDLAVRPNTGRKMAKAGSGIKNNDSFNDACVMPVEQRNKRSVWTVTTQPYAGAHFATYPPELVEPCIKAGCPAGGVVLDPFSGSGTTAMVARALGRHGIGLDLSMTYIRECARPRLQLDALDAWQNGAKVSGGSLADLPMFAESNT